MKIDTFIQLLKHLGFSEEKGLHTKLFNNTLLQVDVNKKKIIYPEKLKIYHKRVCDFSTDENFVVFECVYQLLKKGYKPLHIELEPTWRLGHGASGGRADVLVKDQQNNNLLLIECKTAGKEFDKAWDKTKQDGGQLFSYAHQIPTIKYLCLYASDFTNGEFFRTHKIISHVPFASFASTIKDVTDRFSIWRDTFQLAYLEGGIFEPNIQPYQIGKNKYTLEDDTTQIDPRNKAQKYNQFRTILRKYSIARRETAFEVLVNLFLCKIVDEEVNPKDLKFYWKGIAHDNYFDFVDRLLDLYQQGMDKFLNEKISYISNKEIDSAFWVVKSNRNATKEQIQKYFRELKFFNNSAFSFLDTHNEKLFHENAQVLLEVVQMWQNLRLKSNEQDQFLGDMFEFFLDNSIKQSNGQFFTPLPICKFIVSALPLKAKVAASKDALRVIDYACGSGHFLNEYAHQITSIAKQQGKNPASYYSHITGVEKEYRLAKVAKVAAYMHRHGQIQILDIDALANHEDIKQEGYDVLVANPPFAVEGFLQTLSDEDKHQYSLTKATGKSSNTDAIECFFLERVHYLMAPEGIIGVIVPSLILSTVDSVHTRTRELLLQYFDFVSIVKLDKGTFGKTGFKTVVLFLRRKPLRPECAQHYAIRVDEFFQGDIKHKEYKDVHLVQAYCQHINIPYEEYAKLLTAESKKQIETLFQFEMFKEYLQYWEKSTEVKNLRKTKNFQAKSKKDQQQDLDNLLMGYLLKREKDKLLYFILAHQQAGKVLLVNAPENDKKQKEFLGYEWGTRRRSEGIKYNGGETVNDIITPMFDPKNLDNPNKINTAIRKNFIGELTEPLPEYCQLANLVDMLDFSRTEFGKEISINPQNNITIKAQGKSMKLGDVLQTIESGNRPEGGVENISSGAWSLGGEHIHPSNGKVYLENPKYVPVNFYNNNRRGMLKENDILLCKDGALTGKIALLGKELNDKKAMVNEHVFILRGKSLIEQKYIFNFLFSIYGQMLLKQNVTGSAQGGLNSTNLKQIKIPLPRKAVQEKIVGECESLDKETEKARQIIIANKQKMEQKMQRVMNAGDEVQRLGEFVPIIESGKRPKGGVGNILSGALSLGGEHIHAKNGKIDLSTPKYVPIDFYDNSKRGILQNNDILLCKDGALTGKIALLRNELTNKKAMVNEHVFILRCDSLITQQYVFYFLYSNNGQELLKQNITGSAQGGLNHTNLKNIKIPIPLLKAQKNLVAELEKSDAKIAEAQAKVDAIPILKNAIIKKHLKIV